MSEEIKTSNALREFFETFRGSSDENGDVLTGRQFGLDVRRSAFLVNGSDPRKKCEKLFKILDSSLNLGSDETRISLGRLGICCSDDELENWRLVLNYIVKQTCGHELPSDSPVLTELVHTLHQGGVGCGMVGVAQRIALLTQLAQVRKDDPVYDPLSRWLNDITSGGVPVDVRDRFREELSVSEVLSKTKSIDLSINDQGAVEIMISVTTAVSKPGVKVGDTLCSNILEAMLTMKEGDKLSDCPLFMKYYYPREVRVGFSISNSGKEEPVRYSDLQISLHGHKTMIQKIIEMIRKFFGISGDKELKILEEVTGTSKGSERDAITSVPPIKGERASDAPESGITTVSLANSVDFRLLNDPEKVQALSTTVQDPNSHQVVQRQLVDAY